LLRETDKRMGAASRDPLLIRLSVSPEAIRWRQLFAGADLTGFKNL